MRRKLKAHAISLQALHDIGERFRRSEFDGAACCARASTERSGRQHERRKRCHFLVGGQPVDAGGQHPTSCMVFGKDAGQVTRCLARVMQQLPAGFKPGTQVAQSPAIRLRDTQLSEIAQPADTAIEVGVITRTAEHSDQPSAPGLSRHDGPCPVAFNRVGKKETGLALIGEADPARHRVVAQERAQLGIIVRIGRRIDNAGVLPRWCYCALSKGPCHDSSPSGK